MASCLLSSAVGACAQPHALDGHADYPLSDHSSSSDVGHLCCHDGDKLHVCVQWKARHEEDSARDIICVHSWLEHKFPTGLQTAAFRRLGRID